MRTTVTLLALLAILAPLAGCIPTGGGLDRKSQKNEVFWWDDERKERLPDYQLPPPPESEMEEEAAATPPEPAPEPTPAPRADEPAGSSAGLKPLGPRN